VELRDGLLRTHRIEAAVTVFAGALWVRLSAQAYNKAADYELLAEAVRKQL
jgi:hypothetical protein